MRPRERGFTLVEILIAVAILGLGIAGIVALFPSTIQTASRAVEDTYASSIADSVVASLSASRREHQIFAALPPAGNRPTKYLIFDHDGVLDQLVTPAPGPVAGAPKGSAYYAANYDKDYIVLLPRAVNAGNSASTSDPMLLYPACPAAVCPAGTATDRSPGTIGGSTGMPDEINLKPTIDGKLTPWIRRTFPCGRYRAGTAPTGFATGDIRNEFLSAGTGSITTNPARNVIDNYPQYSFAFALRRIPFQSPSYSSELYECHVFVFRNFDGSTATQSAIASGNPIPRSNIPVLELVTQIDIGPKGNLGPGQVLINNTPLNSAPGTAVKPNPNPVGDSTEPDPKDEY